MRTLLVSETHKNAPGGNVDDDGVVIGDMVGFTCGVQMNIGDTVGGPPAAV